MADDETFETGDSGASLTISVSAGNLKKGEFVCITGFPCKVIELTTSKTGKHGLAKSNITALIFTGKKYEDVYPTSHSLPSPVVKRSEFQLIGISEDGVLALMDDENETREDLNLPADEEVATRIKEAFEAGKEFNVIVVAAMGKEVVMDMKFHAGQ